MRFWSFHPAYLDTSEIKQVWKNGIDALTFLQKASEHRQKATDPALYRYLKQKHPINAMKVYLAHIYIESQKRGFNYNIELLQLPNPLPWTSLSVTQGQIIYEYQLFQQKLKKRVYTIKIRHPLPEDPHKMLPHPIFVIVPGGIESWEKLRR